MSKIIISKSNSHRKQRPSHSEDSRTHLRDFLTTFKHHKSHRSSLITQRIRSPIKVVKPEASKSLESKPKNKNMMLPMIQARRKSLFHNKFNDFQQKIISNYLNSYVTIKKSRITELKPRKKKRNAKKLKNKLQQALSHDNQTIEQAQFQTIRHAKESIDTFKQYSLRQQPMKHYIQQRAQRKKRQWKETNPLQLQTYFYVLKKNQKKSAFEQDIIQRNSIKNGFKIFKIPSSDEILDFIKHYQPRYKEIKMVQLIKQQNFTIELDKSHLYFGQIQSGKRNGLGVYISQFLKYQGSWKDDQKTKGIEINSIGQYQGTFKEDKRHGKGQLIWKNGQIYQGQWAKGKKHGVGIWTSPKGDSYMGEWIKGIVQGEGIHKTNNEQRYEGSFKNFLKHGWGKEKFPNKDSYQGQYINGLPNGKGTYIWNNKYTFVGNFREGFRHGAGILTSNSGFHFSGTFIHQFPEGKCQIDYGNGQSYTGLLKNGKRNGKGTLKNTTLRRVQVGVWQNDELVIPNI